MDLSGAPTVAELLGRVKERVLDGQHHQDIPFEQVVERVDPVRSLSHHPLFQVMFAWQNTSQGDGNGPSLPGLAVVPAGGDRQTTAKLDLSLSLWEAEDRIVGAMTYSTALFERETVERYVGYLRRVLQEMAADEGRRVDRLSLMPESERVRVLEEWNRTEAEYPGPWCIHTLFEAQAARTPDAVAVTFEGEHLTYAELNRRANRLAHHLRGLGVGPDVRVAISLERGPEMMTGLFAILKAGGAYVPLDPSYPEERLAYMLADSAPAVLLAHGPAAGRLLDGGVPVVDLADSAPWAHRPDTAPAVAGLTPDHSCYVIYTSGSTGRPKGVVNRHRSVANLLAWSQDTWRLQPGEAVLQRISFSFDVSVRELFWPLTGGRPDRDGAPRRPRRPGLRGGPHPPRGNRHGAPAGAAARLRGAPGGGDVHVAAAGDQRRRGAGAGRRTPLRRAASERGAVPHVRPHGDDRGLVRAAVDAGRGGHRGAHRPAHRATRACTSWTPAASRCPRAWRGRSASAGPGVARGYLDRPAATAERFVRRPVLAARPARGCTARATWARWRADGTLEFLGRGDGQVKVRGYRIETGEIEARLAELAGVREAVVAAREDAPGEKRLVAYVVGDETAGADALRAHLAAALPEYMVPAAFVRLDALPLTPNGKVDRRALPAPEGRRVRARAPTSRPAGDVEEILAGIWAEVLGVERVGRRDHFFELGGHSLLAVQVISRVRQALGVEVALGELFTRPVLGDFARELETAARAELPPIEPAGPGRPPSAVVRAAAAVVPGAAGGPGRHVPHAHAPASAGRAGPGGAGARAGRHRGPPRGAAHHLRGGGRPAGAADRAGGRRAPAPRARPGRARRTRKPSSAGCWPRRRVRPSTWSGGRSSAAGWCGWRRTTTCCW